MTPRCGTQDEREKDRGEKTVGASRICQLSGTRMFGSRRGRLRHAPQAEASLGKFQARRE